MIRIILIFSFFITFSFSITGREVMEKQKELQKTNTEQSIELMVLVDEDGTTEKRAVRRYIRKDNVHDLTDSVIIFIAPPDLKGVALLNKEILNNEEEQWVYLPSLKKLQRIAEGSKKDYFMGTDFTYEDLSGDKLDNYKYKLLREEVLKVSKHDKPQKCYVVEAIPTKSYYKKTMYGKKIIWITKDFFYTKKIEFYDKKNKLIKIETSWDFVNLGGTVYRPLKGVMDNKSENHKTLVLVKQIVINKSIPAKIFTQRYFKNEEHMVDN